MSQDFYRQPILNSPYAYPGRHWKLVDEVPTDEVVDARRAANFITPVPRARRGGRVAQQQTLVLNEDESLSSGDQRYEKTAELVNRIRMEVDKWRRLPDEKNWGVSPVTARLLKHWRALMVSPTATRKPFFCQVEAAEVAIWISEVAPRRGSGAAELLKQIGDANQDANPDLSRIALKLATGAGKTTVMAMLIAWQTLNAANKSGKSKFTRGFLIVTPGLTVKDRLRVLQPNDPNNYYAGFGLVPRDLCDGMSQANVVITNYHAFQHRETLKIASKTRGFVEGRRPGSMETIETDTQMLRRAVGDLMDLPSVMVMNDEAHHCYDQKPDEEAVTGQDEVNRGDGGREARKDAEAARLWVNGLKKLAEHTSLSRIIDLSATPFFLRGSGYAEGTLFPWVVSDFSLMDAIECGIVKLPRIPVADDNPEPGADPVFRDLWQHIRADMPTGKTTTMAPEQLPDKLQNAIDQLYGHYAKTYEAWEKAGIGVPPCFIVVCNNIASSRLIYQFLSGYEVEQEDGTTLPRVNDRTKLFSNYDEHDQRLDRPVTILVDSDELESGNSDQLDKEFRKVAQAEIEQFRRQKIAEGASRAQVESFSDSELLREAMNTVGKPGKLGANVRCVVSVSMLTEGWDANNVTHILGVRAFGTQLISEQVVGRALRRMSYDLNDEEPPRFDTEYADVLGINFKFADQPVTGPPKPPEPRIEVHAVSPQRDHLAITWPRVIGYRVEFPAEKLEAVFTEDSIVTLSNLGLGASTTTTGGLMGVTETLDNSHLDQTRKDAIVSKLAEGVLDRKFGRDDGGTEHSGHLYLQVKRICREWIDGYLKVEGQAQLTQVLYPMYLGAAADKIHQAVTRRFADERPVRVLLDPNQATGTTDGVSFTIKQSQSHWRADGLDPGPRCHLNVCVTDSGWEDEFCRVAELHPKVQAYVKNHQLGFEVPYHHEGKTKQYRPDFIVLLDDGHGPDDPLSLVVEVKGFRGEDAVQKAETMQTAWIPGVNERGTFGRWAFVEFTSPFEMQEDWADALTPESAAALSADFAKMVDGVSTATPAT